MNTIERLKEIKQKNTDEKVCPLCGSKAKLVSHQYDPWGDGGGYLTEYWYQCDGCGIIKAGAYGDEKSAKEDWNEVVDYLKERIKEEE